MGPKVGAKIGGSFSLPPLDASPSLPPNENPELCAPAPALQGPIHAEPKSQTQSALHQRAGDASLEKLLSREAEMLALARDELALDVSRLPVLRALARLTVKIDQLLERLAIHIEQEIGPPPASPVSGKPVAYQLFAAGSYARAALSPYSDVDYGILVERNDPEIRDYFHRFSTRLGELLALIDPSGALHPCDLISPSGEAKDALIDTPAAMGRRAASSSKGEEYDSEKIAEYVSSALNATRPVFARHGGGSLHERFADARQSALGAPAPELEANGQRAKLVALLLRSLRVPFGVPKQVPGTFGSFAGQSPEAALEAGRVNVKHDLFKALYFPVITLAALYGIEEVGLPEILHGIEAKGHIPPALSRRLLEIHEALLQWRTQNHLAAGKSEEVMKPLQDHQVRAIRRMVPVLFRLEQELSKLQDADPNRFKLGATP